MGVLSIIGISILSFIVVMALVGCVMARRRERQAQEYLQVL